MKIWPNRPGPSTHLPCRWNLGYQYRDLISKGVVSTRAGGKLAAYIARQLPGRGWCRCQTSCDHNEYHVKETNFFLPNPKQLQMVAITRQDTYVWARCRGRSESHQCMFPHPWRRIANAAAKQGLINHSPVVSDQKLYGVNHPARKPAYVPGFTIVPSKFNTLYGYHPMRVQSNM